MAPLETRIHKAKQLWQQGEKSVSSGDYQRAYQLYTQAHDLIMDCAQLHQQAHERLRYINRKLGNYGELSTDWLLHLFAPLGVFELVSYFANSDAFGSEWCKRNS